MRIIIIIVRKHISSCHKILSLIGPFIHVRFVAELSACSY